MSRRIPPNSTIRDLIHTLVDPIEYVRDVIRNFVLYGYDPETDAVRIGIKGRGLSPNYRLEKPPASILITMPSCQFEIPITPPHTFCGSTPSREMTELDNSEWNDENWSKSTMTFPQLQELLSKLWQNKSKH